MILIYIFEVNAVFCAIKLIEHGFEIRKKYRFASLKICLIYCFSYKFMRFTANWFLSVPSERKNYSWSFVSIRDQVICCKPPVQHTQSQRPRFLASQQFFLILMPWYHRHKVLTKTEMIWASRNGPKIAVIVPYGPELVPYMLNFDRKTFITSWVILPCIWHPR